MFVLVEIYTQQLVRYHGTVGSYPVQIRPEIKQNSII
jgi:hypothetical protein